MVKKLSNKEESPMTSKTKVSPKKKEAPVTKEKKVTSKASKSTEPVKTKSTKKEVTAKPKVTATIEKKQTAKVTSKSSEKKEVAKPALKTAPAIEKKEATKPTEQKPKATAPLTIEKKSPQTQKAPTPSILTRSIEKAPSYSLADDIEVNAKKINFNNIIPHEDILKALAKSNFKQSEENLQKILQAVLRGSDVCAYFNEIKNDFLIGAVGSTYKFLSGSLARIEAKQPVALILAQDEKRLHELYQATKKVFSQLEVQINLLSAKCSDEEKKSLSEKHCDILFSTPEEIQKNQNELNLNSIGLCFVYDVQNSENETSKSLSTILKLLPQERVQKIFLCSANTPKTRELAFQYLENGEFFYFLPNYVKDKSPKQFAHALTATQKFQVLLGHLKHHKPNFAAVFANTKSVAEWIAFKLHGNGIKVELVTSSLNYQKKQTLLKSLHNGDINVIVTTDYHTSSLGFENLNCLYQFDLPDSPAKFLDRLSLIENSKNPLSISFICEDYGYNMGKIEENLGFKIHVVHPDKEYFKLKDESEYPLEADGRVKRIGQVYPQTVIGATQSATAPATQAPYAARTTQPITTQSEKIIPTAAPSPIARERVPQQPVTPHVTLQPRPERTERPQTAPSFAAKAPYEARPNNNKFEPKNNDKFIRRDEKAKEALEAARLAAQEKRKAATAEPKKSSQNKNILSIAASIMQDTIKAASSAAKESFTKNMQDNMPVFASLLSKVPFLKREKENN